MANRGRVAGSDQQEGPETSEIRELHVFLRSQKRGSILAKQGQSNEIPGEEGWMDVRDDRRAEHNLFRRGGNSGRLRDLLLRTAPVASGSALDVDRTVHELGVCLDEL